jgi:hypothetical protein
MYFDTSITVFHDNVMTVFSHLLMLAAQYEHIRRDTSYAISSLTLMTCHMVLLSYGQQVAILHSSPPSTYTTATITPTPIPLQ